MTRGRALNRTLRAAGIPSTFTKWRDSLHTVTNGESSAGPRRERQCTPLQSTPATSGPRSPMAHRPPTPPTRRRRQRAHGANIHAPQLQPPSSPPLRSGGLPLWATALSPEPGPRGRTQPRPATPAPKPRLTSPSAFQQNISQVNDTRAEYIMHSAQPAAERRWSNRRTYTHAARGL